MTDFDADTKKEWPQLQLTLARLIRAYQMAIDDEAKT